MSGRRASLLPGLTGLRGVACLWVFLYHFEQSGSSPWHEALPVLRHGYLGVDVFFLLSGFVLFHVYDSSLAGGFDARAYRDFLRVRLARIYPLHLASLLLVLLLVVLLPGFAAPFAAKPAQFSAASFGENLLLVQNWALHHQTSWNTPSWSLSAEWFAYLCFPLVFAAARRVGSPAVAVSLAGAALLALSAGLALAGKTLEGAGPVGMARLGFEFSAGALLCRAERLGLAATPILGRLLAPAPGLLIAAALLWLGLRQSPASAACLPGFALLLLAAAAPRGPVGRMLGARPLVLAGEISFSLYMLHWIGLSLSNALLAGRSLAPAGLLGWNALLLASILAASVASWRWIEIPARAWGRRLGAARPATARIVIGEPPCTEP